MSRRWRSAKRKKRKNAKRADRTYCFNGSVTTVSGHHGRKYAAARAAVQLGLSADDVGEFLAENSNR